MVVFKCGIKKSEQFPSPRVCFQNLVGKTRHVAHLHPADDLVTDVYTDEDLCL